MVKSPLLRWFLALIFIAFGVLHFVRPLMFERIVPPMFPSPGLLVRISGICEVAGGVGLLIRPLRRLAGWGLIALLIAVFPANIYMAISPEKFVDLHIPYWILLWRLPLQPVLVWMVILAISQAPSTHKDCGPA